MFSAKPRALTLTFFLYIALALTLVAAKGPANVNVIRRDHINLTRLIKKRAPQTGQGLGALIGAAPDPSKQSSSTSSAVQTSTTGVTQTSSSATLPTPSSVPLVSPTSVTSTSTSSDSTLSSQTSSASSNATSSALSTTSAPPSTTSAAQTSQTLNVVGVSSTPVVSVPDNTQTITQTATGQAASATAPASAAGATTSTKKTTLTVLIVIASCIGGIAVIWTIIRKWKFRPSSQFEDRMQPIDWQPTSNPDDGIVPAHRRLSNASSFHSGSGHIDGAGLGGGYGATSDHSNGLAPLPDHDFTPGPATLAPVGGYADLARGPSSQPQMQQALSRGPSATRPNFSVPIHHQAAYGAQDPYGGVY